MQDENENNNRPVFKHISIMPEEVIKGLAIKPDGIYVDGTMGGAGHGQLICEQLETGRYIGIDRDEDAINAGKERLQRFGERATVVRSNYSEMKNILAALDIPKVDGILLDLGVSSYQLDTAERGFSYMHDAPLDMRMDNRVSKTAKDIVNGYSETELARVLFEYGEEDFAKQIARRIVKEREVKPIETTGELVEVIKAALPMKAKIGQGHPAKKTFQALRIELNEELAELRLCLESMIDMLNPGGRFVIITFHSLEDRIVKSIFKTAENPCTCPPQFPVCVCGKKPLGKVITKKPIVPSAKEIAENPRAKSSKLRIFERG
ncbi:MAG: 16S rRNA (cytosine(1402)-N(4))-methyltransferase RsmH [Lachnospiraceae bacterium]|nr:16S rRNA (cytosine(1402)-N(4))-methyltransferase RsmH [Lachnospiraceae bacterium]MBP5184954.1 16S rRNA (cytosine(1402)-N(4))-methyltransferase RsmH [Lachnospiraceae bacterium]